MAAQKIPMYTRNQRTGQWERNTSPGYERRIPNLPPPPPRYERRPQGIPAEQLSIFLKFFKVQLIFTTGVIAVFQFSEEVQKFAFKHYWIIFVCLGVNLLITILICCSETIRRQVPLNFIILAIYTISMSFLLGIICVFYRQEIVLMAAGITAGICLLLTIFAMQTKIDFTVCGAGLFVGLILLMVVGIAAIFIRNKILHLVYSCIGALLFSLYLIYDTQLIMGGNHKYALSPEEYIAATLSLYIDIVQIFMYILAILGNVDD